MKFLGLTGVLLWLGTLLASAGSAERARLDASVAAEWAEQELLASALCALEKEQASSPFFAGSSAAAEVPVTDTVRPVLDVVCTLPREAAARSPAGRKLAWPFSQGPPAPFAAWVC